MSKSDVITMLIVSIILALIMFSFGLSEPSVKDSSTTETRKIEQ